MYDLRNRITRNDEILIDDKILIGLEIRSSNRTSKSKI